MLKNPFYVYGPKDVDVPANLHFGEFILDKMLQYEGDAIVNGATNESITFKQIAQEAINLAVSLTQLGVRKGDVIVICSENNLEFWSAALAIMCSGAIVTAANVAYSKDELIHVMNISKPKYVFISQLGYKTHYNNLKLIDSLKKFIIFGDEIPKNVLRFKDLISKHVNHQDFVVNDVCGQVDTLAILYSSGTTGLPKGAMLTHHNALLACNMTGKDPSVQITNLAIAPFFHAMGFMGVLNNLIGRRITVYLPRFDETLYLETIQKYKVNMMTMVPPIAVLLTKSTILKNYDVSSVKIIFCGAAPLDVDTVKELMNRFPNLISVLQGYGMTESTLAVTRDDEEFPKPGSVGKCLFGAIIKVVDIENRKPLGPNQTGEICIKGPIVMKGYVGRNRKEDFDEEGFYRTGDIGYYDDDQYFWIVDRLKELIKYKGYQVPPAEIEAVLLQHPDVRDVGVVGLAKREVGEVPVAFVVKKPNVDVTEKEIVDFVASKLSNPKRLRGGVRFIDQIPKNPSGKILRKQLRLLLKSTKSKL